MPTVRWGELEWDYDSDNVGNARIVKKSGDMDHQIARLDYDAPRFRLQNRNRMGKHPRGPLGLDIHNFIRGTSGYQRIEQMYDMTSSTEYLCR